MIKEGEREALQVFKHLRAHIEHDALPDNAEHQNMEVTQGQPYQ